MRRNQLAKVSALALGFGILGIWEYPSPSLGQTATPASPIPPSPLAVSLSTENLSSRASPERAPASLSTLAHWIQSDSLCNEQGQYRREEISFSGDSLPELSRTDLYSALLLAQGNKERNPCAMALLPKDRTTALRLARKSEDLSCRFLRALLLTDQVDGIEERHTPSPEDLAEGRALLARLGRADPENGIYPFFELGAVQQQAETATAAEREEAYRALLDSRSFRDPLVPLYREMRNLGHLTATSYLFAVELWASSRIPDYSHASAAMRELLSKERDPRRPLSWALQVERELEEIDQKGLVEPNVLLIELAFLKSLASKAWATHAGQALPPRLLNQEAWVAFFRRRTQLAVDAGDLSVYVDGDCRKTLAAIRKVFPKLVESDRSQSEHERGFF